MNPLPCCSNKVFKALPSRGYRRLRISRVRKNTSSAGRSLVIPCRNSYSQSLRRQELLNLQSKIPTMAVARHATEVDVIEEAIRYIDQLHATVLARVKSGSLPPDALQRIQHAVQLDSSSTTNSASVRVPMPGAATPCVRDSCRDELCSYRSVVADPSTDENGSVTDDVDFTDVA